MTKEEYLNRKQLLDEKMLLLRNDISNLKHNYIEANRKFEVGEKVIKNNGMGNMEIGILTGYKVDFFGDIIPKCKKCKKDGSISKIKMCVYSDDNLVSYDNAN